MIDIGGVKFTIDVEKVVESKKKVFQLRQELVEVDKAFGDDIKTQKQWLAELRKSDSVTKSWITGAKNTKEAISKLDEAAAEYVQKLRLIQKEQAAFAKNPAGFLATQKKMPVGAAGYISNKEAYGTIASSTSAYATQAANYLQNARANKSSGFNTFSKAAAANELKSIRELALAEAERAAAQARHMAQFRKEALARVTEHRREEKVLNKITEAAEKAAARASSVGMKNALTGAPIQSVIAGGQAAKQAAPWWERLNTAMTSNSVGYHTWWKRFGGIAIGFAIAYRAINAVETAIHSVTAAFTNGYKVMDEYREGLAIISGMVALTYKGGTGYLDRYNKVHSVMAATMEQAVRLAPKYKMSLDEITGGFRELAQFGVIVTPDIAEDSIAALAMIREIAMTTGNSTKQIRQEIQALFTGSARQTDQFALAVKKTMPEVAAALANPAITAQEKWKILGASVRDFQHAIVEAAQTPTSQLQIASNTLSIISKQAIEQSGVYQGWVDRMKAFNASLFTSKGVLTPLGEKIKEIFADIWTSIDKIIKTTFYFGQTLTIVGKIAYELTKPIHTIVGLLGKATFALFLFKTTVDITRTIAGGLWKAFGFAQIIAGFGSSATAVTIFNAALLTVPLAFGAGLAAGSAFFIYTSAALATLEQKYGNFFARLTQEWEIQKQLNKLTSLEMSKMNPLNAFKIGDINEEIAEYEKGLARMKAARVKWSGETNDKSFSALFDVNVDKAKQHTLNSYKQLWAGLTGAVSDVIGKDNAKDLQYSTDKLFENLSNILGDGMVNLQTKLKESGDINLLEGLIPPLASPEAAEEEGKKLGSRGAKTMGEVIDQITKWSIKKYEEAMKEIDKHKKLFQEKIDLWRDIKHDEAMGFQLPKVNEIETLPAKAEESASRARQALDNFYNASKSDFEGWLESQDMSLKTLWESLGQSMVKTFRQALAEMYADYLKEFLLKVMKASSDASGGGASSFLGLFARNLVSGLVGGAMSSGFTASDSVATNPNFSLMNGSTTGNMGVSGGYSLIGAASSSTPSASFGMDYSNIGGSITFLRGEHAFASGGIIREPVFGFGLHSGQSYSFAEQGPERVLSNADSFGQLAAPVVNISIINNSKAQVESSQASRMQGNEMIIDVILDDYNKGGKTYKTFGR